ncbi:hypothetical protein BKA64DRAFT_705588 [Cadophora sp. MPI-SDFR-AT-0126]|nr:hypothetical protein BKA64DRAFT_705588 [Leotiomycetes sp. MPI-SDFR-AT-0126]
MGVPFSHEVQNASHHIDTIAPILRIALWTIICVSVILLFLISLIAVAFIALLITVNPDLVEERKRLVTPVLRACLQVPSMLPVAKRSEQSPTVVPAKKTQYQE